MGPLARPSSSRWTDKCFPAQVYADGAALPAHGLLPGDTLVLISEPVVWTVEYRCFVHERQVLTCSPYWRAGALAQDEDGSWPAPAEERAEALAFAAQLLADPEVALPPACVVDLGQIAGKGWALVEANSAWGAGIYGCDPAEELAAFNANLVGPIEVIASYPPESDNGLSAA